MASVGDESVKAFRLCVAAWAARSEEHTSELQSPCNLVCRLLLEKKKQVVRNAQALAAALVELGYAIVSGGTDTHLMLVDLRPKEVTGKEAQELLDRAGITVNKNTIPGDPQKAFVTSGIRIGTPAVTTRGFTEAEMPRVAEF